MGVILIYVETGHACMWNFPPFFRRAYPLSHSSLSGTVCGLVWWPSATEERARPSSLLSFSPHFLCFHGPRWDDNRHTRGTCLSTICCCCCLPNPDSKRNRLRIAVSRERPYWNAGVNRGDVCHPYMCMPLLCMVWCIEMDVWVSLDSPWIHRCVHMYMCIPLTASIITVASKCSAKFPQEKSSNSPSRGIFQAQNFLESRGNLTRKFWDHLIIELKSVQEAYPFCSTGWLLLLYVHTTVFSAVLTHAWSHTNVAPGALTNVRGRTAILAGMMIDFFCPFFSSPGSSRRGWLIIPEPDMQGELSNNSCFWPCL